MTIVCHINRLCPMGIVVSGLVIAAAVVAAEPSPGASRPHILFLLADDLGWGDVGFHGSEIKTPCLDRLAAGGVRLEQFYVQPVCSPTRSSLMTGRYPMRQGLQVGVVRPWATYGLPLEERTLAQALHEAGYTTAICGKWHLGHFEPPYLPTRRGFDHQYGLYNGMIDYFTHARDGGHDWHRDDNACYDKGYSTHLIAREAVRLVDGHDPHRPLFLYVPFNAVHSPLQVPEEYMKPYERLRPRRRAYAGMVAAMDEAVGQIVAAFERKALMQDTLIVFCSDNGGPSPGVITSNGPFRAGKGTLYEGGVRVAAFASWQGKIKPGSVVQEPLHMVDWYPTLLKLAGAPLAQRLPLDGRDAWATIAQGQRSPHEEILHNAAPSSGAIRVGNWKLVINGSHGTAEGRAAGATRKSNPRSEAEADERGDFIELFNIAHDPYEKDNQAANLPEKAKELLARYETLARQAMPPKTRPQPPGFQSPRVWGESE